MKLGADPDNVYDNRVPGLDSPKSNARHEITNRDKEILGRSLCYRVGLPLSSR